MKSKKIDIEKLLKDTGYMQYIEKEVAETSPITEGKIEFFNLEKHITDNELEKEYESRGLIPAGLNSLCEYVIDNPDYSQKYIGTHWKDVKGKWCYIAFDRWGDDERDVDVDRDDHGWGDDWWFAGVRKLDLKTSDT